MISKPEQQEQSSAQKKVLAMPERSTYGSGICTQMGELSGKINKKLMARVALGRETE